jgi:ABC-type uncharacterized transport system involved in gliding motility auxiliary subunit
MGSGDTDTPPEGRRPRRREAAARGRAGVAIALAALALVMVNYLACRYLDLRADVSSRRYYTLSDKTQNLLRSLAGDIRVVVFFQRNHVLYDDVRNLLREYEYAASKVRGLYLRIAWVDPDRELAATRELAREFDVTEPNVVVFAADGRRRHVDVKELTDSELSLQGGRPVKRMTAFRGEDAFSSALQSVMRSQTPRVYFLGGHGEHGINDTHERLGYSRLARIIRRDNIEVRTLLLGEQPAVPEDCAALVIAGADRKLSAAELDWLADYLNKNGRLLVLLDAGTFTGLEPLLEAWGIRLAPDVVVGLTLTGRELVVSTYGDHTITRGLRNVVTMFYEPRSVGPLESGPGGTGTADRPGAAILALSTPQGWAEMNPAQSPPQFDDGVDQRGPVPVAAAVERAARSGIRMEIKPTRLVVIGDSQFVSNGALGAGVGGNEDFFMNALNWLLEREELMGIAPRVPGALQLDMDQRQIQTAFLVVVLSLPAAAALAGITVWWKRRA